MSNFAAGVCALCVCICHGRRHLYSLRDRLESRAVDKFAVNFEQRRRSEGGSDRLAAFANFLTALPRVSDTGESQAHVLKRVSDTGLRYQATTHSREKLLEYLLKRRIIMAKDDKDDEDDDEGGAGRSLVQQISDIFFKHKAKFRGNGGGGNHTDDDDDIYGDLSEEERDIM
jgi:hypothetical protein